MLVDYFLLCLYCDPMPHKHSRSALRSSTAVEDYLERILELINSKGYARVVDIAAALKISQASVTNMVRRLDAEGLLKYEKYRGLILTAAGKSLAHSHRLGQAFGSRWNEQILSDCSP